MGLRYMRASRTMLDFVKREAEHLYSSGEGHYRLKLFGAEITPHGHRQTLRVRVAFVSDDIREQGQAKTGLERINFTYTFSPGLSPERNLRRFRRYVTLRAGSLHGIEPKLILQKVWAKRPHIPLVTTILGVLGIIGLVVLSVKVAPWVVSGEDSQAFSSGEGSRGLFSFLTWLVIGLIAGALARVVITGKETMNFLTTMVLGIMGSVVGGFIGKFVLSHDGQGFMNRGGMVLSAIGAVILVFVWYRLHPGTQQP
jgi:uncharacterized membrane protein YeaQ/YmgE (transglycosylase-associated protein family)